MPKTGTLRIRVIFPGRPPRDYRAAPSVADRYAMATVLQGATVIVDGATHPDLPFLNEACLPSDPPPASDRR